MPIDYEKEELFTLEIRKIAKEIVVDLKKILSGSSIQYKNTAVGAKIEIKDANESKLITFNSSGNKDPKIKWSIALNISKKNSPEGMKVIGIPIINVSSKENYEKRELQNAKNEILITIKDYFKL